MRPANVQRVPVASANDINTAVTSYVAQGYVVIQRSAEAALLQRKKEFKIVWAVIGFLFCVVPLAIYLIIYALQPDVEVVDIVVVGP